MRQRTVLPILLLVAACGARSADPAQPAPQPEPPAPAAAPWSQPALAAAAVPGAYLEEWRKADNRASCAPIAPSSLGTDIAATARRASFSGGWAVAYDLPELRSAFGVAGTGVAASAPSYSDWPYGKTWRDGSSAGYGPEGGGSGPNQLAYLRIAGQGCLYNVWSRLGRQHLEHLLEHLRYIDTP